MDDGEVFQGYDEGPITFLPTYKYDNGTNRYDSSEKARIPAWTDRILFKGTALRLKNYGRAELWTSDHRPVYAVFDATVREVDQKKKDRIADEILQCIRGRAGDDEMDEKVERAQTNGKFVDLPKTLVHRPSPSASPIPRLPPRPETGAGSNGTKSAATHGYAIRTSPRKPAPPAPVRNSPQLSNGHRPSPPIPANSAATPLQTNVAYVSANEAPPLPARSGTLNSKRVAVTRASLDMNGSLPSGLAPPVEPTRVVSPSTSSYHKAPPPAPPSRSTKPSHVDEPPLTPSPTNLNRHIKLIFIAEFCS